MNTSNLVERWVKKEFELQDDFSFVVGNSKDLRFICDNERYAIVVMYKLSFFMLGMSQLFISGKYNVSLSTLNKYIHLELDIKNQRKLLRLAKKIKKRS